jgi:hypothetical protein
VVIDPHAVGTRHPDHAVRAITALAIAVTERPWSLTARDLEAPRAAGLDDASILHVVLQAAYFGHLNRIADAVGVAADYPDRFGAPHVETATPSNFLPVDPQAPGAAEIHLGLRPGIEAVYAAWRMQSLESQAPALDRRRRSVIAQAVADRLGDLRERAGDPVDELDHALIELADLVTTLRDDASVEFALGDLFGCGRQLAERARDTAHQRQPE